MLRRNAATIRKIWLLKNLMLFNAVGTIHVGSKTYGNVSPAQVSRSTCNTAINVGDLGIGRGVANSFPPVEVSSEFEAVYASTYLIKII